METKRTIYEFKHVTSYPALTQRTIDMHSLFFWEVQGTDSISSSYLERTSPISLERQSDTIYSVVERSTNVNFRRPKDLDNLQEIRTIEEQYFQLAAEQDRLRSIPIGWNLFMVIVAVFAFMFYVIPGIFLVKWVNRKKARVLKQVAEIESTLGSLLVDNAKILNLPDEFRDTIPTAQVETRSFQVTK